MSLASSESTATPEDKYRLPTNVKPSHYDLTVWTDLKRLQFGGFVIVNLHVEKETTSIVLNCSADLILGKTSLHSEALKNEQLIDRSAQVVDKDLGRVTFNFLKALPAGSEARLKIDFNAMLRGSMNGYYKSAWEKDGQTDYYALTQFQPIEARTAFPCWDEPLLKATFGITMISRVDTVNISNMPATSEIVFEPDTENHSLSPDLSTLLSTLPKDIQWKITQFQDTPPMSSYLVAYANGPFSHLEQSAVMPLSGKTVPLRIYTTPDLIHQAEFALEVAARVLPLYETIFNIEYPLPKLDTLAAHDFDMGAMENWGLITGRVSALLLDPKKADVRSRKNVARTQSHEVAHMWFGNITTMEWWKYLYLNEGFATLMGECVVMNKIFPEWGVTSSFISDHLLTAFAVDAKRSSHPIEVDCPDANFINQIFDRLSYDKAASVLRMLSEYVGEERFLEGVTIYLKKKLYGNSVTNDLWDGISTATGLDVHGVMDNWVSKIGFPLITVTETPSGVHIRQDRFLNNGHPSTEENQTIWKIPLGILTVDQSGTVHVDKTAILEEREKTIPLDISRSFKLNARTVGVYRVLYTPERFAKIASDAAKDDSVFSKDDRIGLISDVAALSRAGLTKLSALLELINIWRNEKEYLVWMSIADSISSIDITFWEHPQHIEQLNAFRRFLFVPLVERLGYDSAPSDSVDIIQLRKMAVSGAVAGGAKSVIQELRSRFDHFAKTGDDSRIPPDLQQTIFIAAVEFGGQVEFNKMLTIIQNPPNPSARSAAIVAFGATQDANLIKQVFTHILTKARDQDVITFCRGLKANIMARRPLTQFFKDNYETFSKRFATNSMLKYMIPVCCSSSTKEDYKDIREFFKDKDTSRYSMALAQTLETIQTRIALIERSSDDLSDWLTKWEQRSAL